MRWITGTVIFILSLLLLIGWSFSRAYYVVEISMEQGIKKTALNALGRTIFYEPPLDTTLIEKPQIPPKELQNPTILILPEELYRAVSCESSFEGTPTGKPQQFEKDGSIRKHVNENGSTDWGAGMINDRTWGKKAEELGLDYKNNEEDNLKMTKHIFTTQGIGAWLGFNSLTGKCVWQ